MAWDTACGPCCWGTLLPHVQLAAYQDFQVFFSRADPSQSVPSLGACLCICPCWIPSGFCWPGPPAHIIPLKGSLAFRRGSCFTPFGVTCKPAKSALHCFLQVTDKNVEQDRPQYRIVQYPTYYLQPSEPNHPTTLFNPSGCPSIQNVHPHTSMLMETMLRPLLMLR